LAQAQTLKLPLCRGVDPLPLPPSSTSSFLYRWSPLHLLVDGGEVGVLDRLMKLPNTFARVKVRVRVKRRSRRTGGVVMIIIAIHNGIRVSTTTTTIH